MRNAFIASSAMYVPERVLPNAYFNALLGEDVDAWLKENVEIYERRWCAENESTADLCVAAAQKALLQIGLSASELDLIIVATDTPEYISPSTASVVQYRLGATRAGTFDINTACAGFVTGLDMAAKYIRSDQRYNHILVIGAYAMSKYLDLTDKKTVTLFADGAGAVVLQAEENTDRGYLTSLLHTEGQYHDWMGIYAGGTHQPVSPEALKNKDHLLKFVRKFPKELNPRIWSRMIEQMARALSISVNEVNFFLFTQININSIRQTLDRLNIPHDRTHTIMHYYGYTGSACIPMALSEALEQKKIKAGDTVFFISSGGGLAFASAAFKF
ncbi:3-oxoacyl-ACP synthase III family protein [Calditrichota bacterium LG25]